MSTKNQGSESGLDVTKITEALKAGEFDKAVELTNALEVSDEIKIGLLEEIEDERSKVAEPEKKPEQTGSKEPASDKVQVSTAEHIALEEEFKLAFDGGNIEKMEELTGHLADDDTFKEFGLEKIEESKTIAFEAKISEVRKAIDGGNFDEAIELLKDSEISKDQKEALVNHIKLRKAVAGEFAAGHHNKAAKLVEKLPKDDPFKISVLVNVEAVKEAGKKQSVRPVKKPAEIKAEDILAKWNALIDIIEKYLAQQQLAGRAWRHINLARNNVMQRKEMFKRNLPKK